MSSRQEEKARRRAEREALERQQAAKAANTRRLQIVGGVVLAIAAIGAIVVAVTSGGSSSAKNHGPTASGTKTVAIPAPKITNLAQAAAAAGCVVKSFPNYGQTHVTTKVTYKTNPPTSGPHNPVPAAGGIYAPGNEPEPENYVHTLEHGRVEIQYAPGTSLLHRQQLETLYNEKLNGVAGYLQLLFQNNTKMPYAVAATAWQHLLGCTTFNAKVFDAIRDFRKLYVDKAPEPSSAQAN